MIPNITQRSFVAPEKFIVPELSAQVTTQSSGAFNHVAGYVYRWTLQYADLNAFAWWFNGHTPIYIEYGKLDLGMPLRRKRIHRMIIPYHGALGSITVEIRHDHADTYVQCTSIDKGEYVEVRCPSMVSRSFDIRISASSSDYDFMLSPPFIIEFEPRGPEYGKV